MKQFNMSFDQLLPTILEFEGGYANNKNDPGGATNFGIIQAEYNHYLTAHELPIRSVKDITKEEVEYIYKNEYYKASKLGLFEASHPHTALCHFDCAVNQGTGTAKYLLQKAINEAWNVPKIVVDGIIGPKTIQALQAILDNALLKKYLEIRKLRYDNLLKARPWMVEFRASWYHRLNVIARKSQLDWNAA